MLPWCLPPCPPCISSIAVPPLARARPTELGRQDAPPSVKRLADAEDAQGACPSR
jgi:hypothetical protein